MATTEEETIKNHLLHIQYKIMYVLCMYIRVVLKSHQH